MITSKGNAGRASFDQLLARLPTGFRAPARDSQTSFRQLLKAMSFPGQVLTLAPANLAGPSAFSVASAALLTALPDSQSRVWHSASLQQDPHVRAYLQFHTGCTIVDDACPLAADMAWIAACDTPDLDLCKFAQGSDLEPHLGASLFIEVAGLSEDVEPDHREAGGETGPAVTLSLTGPGIASTRRLVVTGLHKAFWQARQATSRSFPRGLDLVLTCRQHLAALPRTTQLELV